MRRERVSSSVLVSVGYDQGKGVLEVEFAGGRVYRYFVVPAAVYRQLMEAESLGRHFNEFVRDKYPVREVE